VIIDIWFTGTRTLKNFFGQVDGEIEQYRTTLVRLRDDFLARAVVTTEVAVIGIQGDVTNIQAGVSNIQANVCKMQDNVSSTTSTE
jgi:hypothetical protein